MTKTLLLGGALLIVGQPELYRRFPPLVVEAVSTARSLAGTQDKSVAGYYQDLNNLTLAPVYEARPAAQNFIALEQSAAASPTPDLRRFVLRPSVDVTFHNARLTTNRWGMRDREYEKSPPPGVTRAAMIGSCSPMGWGVEVEQSVPRRLEARLNERVPNARLEILNFGVGEYLPPAVALHFSAADVLSFQPRVVFLYALPHELEHTRYALSVLRRAPPDEIDPRLAEILVELAPSPRTRAERNAYWAAAERVLQQSYRDVAEASRERGVLPVFVYADDPVLPASDVASWRDRMFRQARQAGFVILDASRALEGLRDRREVVLDDREVHLDARGHALVADAIADAVLSSPEVSRALFATAPTSAQ